MLSDITGKAPLMPYAAYGVWWCQCCPQYTNTTFQTEILAMYKQLDLPLSVTVIDSKLRCQVLIDAFQILILILILIRVQWIGIQLLPAMTGIHTHGTVIECA